MSNLPPKPDFEPPLCNPSDSRHHARPSSKGAPDRRERDRPMDSYVPGRSPPRRREESHVAGDTYIPSSRHEPYRSRPVDSYTPGYNRREDDRYRTPYREHDRDPPPHRDWRSRDHPPPPSDWRYARDAKAGAAWSRSKEAENYRYWETKERERRGYERDYSSSRRRDSKLPTPERTWVPRASKSPPRRMVVEPPQPGPSGQRGRSPAPHLLLRDDGPSRIRDRSPRQRRSRSYDSRRDDRSAPVSPRKDDQIRRDKSPRDDRRRSPYRGRSRSYTRSPVRRRRRRGGRRRRGAAEKTEAGEVEESLSRSSSGSRSRTRSPTRSLSKSRSRSMSRSPVVKREHRLPKRDTPEPIKLKMRTPSPVVKREPSLEPPIPMEPEPAETKAVVEEVAPAIDADGDVKMEDEVKPPMDVKPVAVASPTSPATPHTPHQLPLKPYWSHTGTNKVVATPERPASSAEVKPSVAPLQPTLPDVQLSDWVPHEDKTLSGLMAQITRLEESRIKQAKEHDALQRSTRRAMHELEMASHDLKFAEKRRVIADAQLEKARAGILGIDYPRKIEPTAARVASSTA